MRRTRLAAFGAIVASLSAVGGLAFTGEGAVPRGRRPGPPGRPSRHDAHRHTSLSVGAEPRVALPFPPNPDDRIPRPGEVPSLYGGGVGCSTGCRPPGAELGWPIKPWHREHGIRAALNELRSGSLHVAVDIQARVGAAVYALQPGVADVLAATGPNSRVQVGNYIYWHITPAVATGETVAAFRTIIGHVQYAYGHLALSELSATGAYVNPLRPGGIVLSPYVNHAPPEIARPDVASGGQIVVRAYSPQSFVETTTYPTPVLAPAGLAWRLYQLHGRAVTPLEWAFRGIQLLPFAGRDLIYAPGAHAPGFGCFATRSVCVPDWSYRLAGGFTPPLPPSLPVGGYRLTIYAWDWAGNRTALDTRVNLTRSGWEPIGRFPTSLYAAEDWYTTGEGSAASADSGPDPAGI